jgi:hypothetical protein
MSRVIESDSSRKILKKELLKLWGKRFYCFFKRCLVLGIF